MSRSLLMNLNLCKMIKADKVLNDVIGVFLGTRETWTEVKTYGLSMDIRLKESKGEEGRKSYH